MRFNERGFAQSLSLDLGGFYDAQQMQMDFSWHHWLGASDVCGAVHLAATLTARWELPYLAY